MNILEEYNDDQSLDAIHIYNGNMRLATIIPGDDIYYVCTDQIMSNRAMVDESFNIDQQRTYYPYGEEVSSSGTVSAYKYGGKECDATGLYYFGKRYYDPTIGRWLSCDPAEQGWSPYVYCGGNPVNMVDPDGTIFGIDDAIFWGIVIGSGLGGYSGYKIGEAKGTEGLEMAGYILGGAAIGGVSGYVGASIAAGGGFMANTSGIMASSFYNSMGMTALSCGMMQPSVSFGFGSYNFGTGEFGYLGKEVNSTWENVGYGLGLCSNLSDLNKLIDNTNAHLITETKENYQTTTGETRKGYPHSAIITKDDNTTLLSWGPGGGRNPKNWIGSLFRIRKSTAYYPIDNYNLPIDITVNKYTFAIVRQISKILPFQGASLNCVNMASLSLWLNGIPNIGIHPYLLYGSTWLYSSGLRPDLFSYYFNQ